MINPIKIAVDAMGGDNAPKKIINGIIHNHRHYKNNFFIIFGKEKEIIPHINNKIDKKFYKIVNTENLAPVVEVPEKEAYKTEAVREVEKKKEETKSENISEKI